MMRGKPVSRRSGFTLIEMATALLIVSLAVAVAVPAFRSLGEEDDITSATHRIETLFRLARDSAIHSGLPVTVVIDSVGGLVWIDTPKPLGLGSAEVRATLAYPDALPAPGSVGATERAVDTAAILKPGQSIGLPSSVRMVLPRARARFSFQPTGAALADTMLLTGSFGTRAITLDPWTGDVRVR